MMRSLFSGVTGLRSHQTKMDVIGNNISNVNTLGYKKSVANFADLYSETVSIATGASGVKGGTNPRQIGLGTKVNSIVIKHSPGAAQYTGNTLDVAIEGDGFFVLRTPDGERYSRAGDLAVDGSGFLVNQSGYKVQCYNTMYKQGDAGKSKVIGLNNNGTIIDTTFTEDASATGVKIANSGTYTFALEPNPTATDLPIVKIYKNGVDVTDIVTDNGTNPVVYKKAGTPITTIASLTNDAANSYTVTIPGMGEIEFKIDGANPDDGTKAVANLETVLENATVVISNNDGFIPGSQIGDMEIDQDIFTNFAINEAGALIAQLKEDTEIGGTKFAKDEQVVLGYLAMANFVNLEGLQKVSTNMYRSSANSGNATYGIPGTEGFGALTPSSLEMSNVDLSEEMVGMITTQRGFQANSRIITTTDSMLEELVNLKR